MLNTGQRCPLLTLLSKYGLRPDALRLLDLLGRLDAGQAGALLMAEGSQGQPVASSLLAEIRHHRLLLARLLDQLALPDADAARVADMRRAGPRRAVRLRVPGGRRSGLAARAGASVPGPGR